jgi:hypothetical protein
VIRIVKSGFSDEDLMLFADGQADKQLASKIEAALIKDDELAQRVEVFRSTSLSLKQAFPTLPDAAGDAKILAAMEQALLAEANSSSQSSNVVSFPLRKAANSNWWQGAVAAAIALGIGLSSGYFAGQQSQEAVTLAGNLPAEAVASLNAAPSGETVQLQDGKITLVASFQSATGDFCREYEYLTKQSGKVTGLACKHQHGWHSVAQVFSESDGSSFVPANGLELVDSIIDRAQLKGPLTEQEEKVLLGK